MIHYVLVEFCENHPSGPLYADPTSCTRYIQCANGLPYVRDCGPGTAFHPSWKVCVYESQVNCYKGIEENVYAIID